MKENPQLPKGVVRHCFGKLKAKKKVSQMPEFLQLDKTIRWLNVLYDTDKEKEGDMAWYIFQFYTNHNLLSLLTSDEKKKLEKKQTVVIHRLPR